MRLHNRLLSVGCISSALVGGSLLHPVVSGQVKPTTHQGAAIGQGLVPAAGLFVGLALLLGLVAFRAHIPTVDRVVSSTTTKRVATVAVVALVVTTTALSGVGGPVSPVGSAEAGVTEQCQFDAYLTDVVETSIGIQLGQSVLCQEVLDGDTDNTTAVDAKSAALSMQSGVDSTTAARENLAQDSRSVAWMKAKLTLINELNNGSSVAEAKTAANQTVEDYYALQQSNLIEDWNARASHLLYLDSVPNVSVHFESGASTYEVNSSFREIGAETELVNGSRKYARALARDGSEEGTALYPYQHIAQADSQPVQESEFENDTIRTWWTNVGDGTDGRTDVVTDEGEVENVLHANNDYNARFTAAQTASTQVKDNVAVFADDLFAAYAAGDINETDLASMSPTTIGSQAATDYDSTGYYGFSNAQLAAMGLDGDTNASHVIETTRTVVNETDGTTETQNVTVTGTLFYTGSDGQVFNNSSTYDPANLGGQVYMTVSSIEDTQSGSALEADRFMHVSNPFTIVSTTNAQTGESMDATEMEVRDYTTTNTSNITEQLDELRELRDYYESQQTAAGVGGFSLNFGGTGTGMLIALAAVVVLLAGTRD